jgi:nicotinamidase-related amidase
MDETLLVVIDAQRAFVDAAGSLVRAFGVDDVQPCTRALARLLAHVAPWERRVRTVFVRSEYRVAQFTDGCVDHPLADLCVPGHGVDCEWASGLEVSGARMIITKHEVDAATVGAYRDTVAHAVSEGVRRVVLAGFQFTTCVRASALSTRGLLTGRGVEVAVAIDLAGARASSHRASAGGVSRVEATRHELLANGVTLFDISESGLTSKWS